MLQGGKCRSINRFVQGYDWLVDMFEGLIHLKRQKHFKIINTSQKIVIKLAKFSKQIHKK